VFVALAAVALGCSDLEPTGTSNAPDRDRVALAVAPTMGTTISPRLSNTDITPSSVGTYPEWTVVEITATGLLNRYFSYAPIWGAMAGNPFGQWDAGGVQAGGSSCIGNVWIAFDSPGFVGFCDNPSTPLRSDWRAVRMVRGEGRVGWVSGPHRTDGTCDTPSTPPCFTYLLDHTVTITPFPAELVLKASKAAIEPGQNVTFTASVTPDSIENIGVPFKVVEWRWLPDAGGGGTVLTQCENQKICSYAPSVSGTMRATGFANGAAAEAEVQVTVFPCLTGDPLLDNPRVRDGLRSSFDSMGYPHLSPADRTERGGGAFLGPNGDTLWVPVFPPGPRDDACSFWPSDHASSFPGNPIISWHGHAFDAGDELPGVDDCYRDPRLAPLGPGDKRYAGARPSSNDINEGGTVDNIIVTPSYVWLRPKYFPNDPPTTLPDSLPRADCDPLAQPIRQNR
jgi:hypothetical protein